MTTQEHSDAELLTQWRGGDITAGSKLVVRHFQRIRRVFTINGSSSEWVEEMTQQTFLICCEKRDDILDDEKFRSYLIGIANNLLRSYFKTKKSRNAKGRPVDLSEVTIIDLEGPGISTMFRDGRERQMLIEALRRIPIESQLILQYRFWDELSLKAIAELDDVPVGTVSGRLRKAKKQLSSELRRQQKLGHHMEPPPAQPASTASPRALGS